MREETMAVVTPRVMGPAFKCTELIGRRRDNRPGGCCGCCCWSYCWCCWCWWGQKKECVSHVVQSTRQINPVLILRSFSLGIVLNILPSRRKACESLG